MNHHLILPGNPLKQWKASLTVPIVSILLLFSSCSQKEHFEGTVLHGKITNYTGGKLTLKALNGFERNIPVDNQGRVKDSFLVDEGLYYLSFSGNFPFVYVTKGSKIEFSVDAKYFDESMVFSGDYADLNNYYLDKMERETGFKVNGKEHYGLDGTGFLDLVNTFQKEQLDRLDRLTDLPEGVKELENRAIAYNKFIKLNRYREYHPDGLIGDGNGIESTIKEEFGQLDYERADDFFYSIDYNQIVFVQFMANVRTYADSARVALADAELRMASEMESEPIKNYMLYNLAKSRYPRVGNKIHEVHGEYLALCTDKDYRQELDKLYQEVVKLAPGSPSPTFEGYESFEGNRVDLGNFLGTNVYIDIWATWCTPCIGEFPYLKELEEAYRDKDISFVGISVDKASKHGAWKKMIVEKGLKGVQLMADDALSSDFIKSYKISGIPRFILLDKAGNIVDPNAPRPSDKRLVAVLDSVLSL